MLRWLSNASVRADRIHVTFGDTNIAVDRDPRPPSLRLVGPSSSGGCCQSFLRPGLRGEIPGTKH